MGARVLVMVQIIIYDSLTNTSSRLSSNSEAFASELLENLKEMTLLHVTHSDIFSEFNFLNIQ